MKQSLFEMIHNSPKKLAPIETSELQKEIEKMFDLFDTDQDGILSRIEIRNLINEIKVSKYLPKLDQIHFSQIVK